MIITPLLVIFLILAATPLTPSIHWVFLLIPDLMRTIHQRLHQQPPSINHNKQQYLNGQRDRSRWNHDHTLSWLHLFVPRPRIL